MERRSALAKASASRGRRVWSTTRPPYASSNAGRSAEGVDPRAIHSPATLAFLGDGVWELYARKLHLHPAKRTATYVRVVQDAVRAESQAAWAEKLSREGCLTELEMRVMRWGRNGVGKVPERLRERGNVYAQATGLEALVGYLYLHSPERLVEVLRCCELVHVQDEVA